MKKYLRWLEDKLNILSVLFVVGFALIYFLPYFVKGENSVVAIHDYLDSIVAFTKMFADNGLYYKIDTPMPALNGISTCFYTFVNFGAYNFIMNYCGAYWGHVINNLLAVTLAYLSMVTLLRFFWNEKKFCPLIRLISVAYAILPVIPNVALGYATFPFMIYLFLQMLREDGKMHWKYLLYLVYPFFSSFYIVGMFVYGFWLVGIIVVSVKNRKVHWGLVGALIAMIVGTVVVDLKLFYTMFVREDVLNRSAYELRSASFWQNFKLYFTEGYYHAASLQKKLLLPICGVLFLWALIRRKNSNTWKAALGILGVIVVFSALGALYDTRILQEPIKRILPIADGLNWGRIFLLNRMLWYVLLFVLLLELMKNDWLKWAAYGIVLLQIVYIYQAPVTYNDSYRNLFYSILPEGEQSITFEEFYAEELFTQIKEDIGYEKEAVAAVGYHPSVLMYNGFNCVDGYMSFYPLEYMVRFRELIEPELDRNEEERAYFDSWGGRMYLYNSEVSYEPTREKSKVPVDLYIDEEVFRQMGGKYILSKAPISNATDLELELIQTYEEAKYLYDIYVYQMSE